MQYLRSTIVVGLVFVLSTFGHAQTTDISYQGSIKDAGIAPTGTYDLEFRLFPVENGGAVIETRQTLAVGVVNGIFSVRLNFLMAHFIAPGQDRYLEIAVRPSGGGSFQTLSPRQRVTFVPYSFRSINADVAGDAMKLGGILPGGFIQNTTSPQAPANFNISGVGRANIFGAEAQFNIAGSRVLSVTGTENLFVGVNAGPAASNAARNTFVGRDAGSTETGAENSFFGYRAGHAGGGQLNSFFGAHAGESASLTSFNSFFGVQAGASATGNAVSNSFFGAYAGQNHTTGVENSFFGYKAGFVNGAASGNTFIGSESGASNTGGFNSFLGYQSGKANTTGFGGSFFGYLAGTATTTGCCNAFFGSAAGKLNTTGSNNAFFGTDIGLANTSGSGNTFVGNSAGNGNTTGSSNTMIGSGANVSSGDLDHATAIGSGSVVSASDTIVLGRSGGTDTVVVPGKLEIGTLGVAGSTQLCLNNSNRVGTCSSSLRYKTNIANFARGLDLVARLRPVSYSWKQDPGVDVGLVAEEVADVEPLLVTLNKDGQLEGVKYDRITVVLLNAVREQQKQIERQQKVIDGLIKVLCAREPDSEGCRN
ncbi:MAG TPA: tail fiber domain-containing protein [Pyrinomonadaceae bacterium]|nr:tail fiber domain-containing protein [Pyrinomonadaceae bacterium]